VLLPPDSETERWRELIAIGVVSGNLGPDEIARGGNVSRLEALEAIATARSFGILDENDQLHPDEAARMIADLGIDEVSRVHAELATHYMTSGRELLADALTHARQVTRESDTEMMISMCDHAGEINLALGDYAAAQQLFDTSDKLDLIGDDSRQGRRLLLLAAAVDGAGDVIAARKLLERAAVLGERSGDVDLLVDAAVRHTLPTDWYAGDHRSLVMLQRAELKKLSSDQLVRVRAARSLAEARIPVVPHEGQQTAWITRPEVAQPLSGLALQESEGLSIEARAMALLAWRSNHRSPKFLTQRLKVSEELLLLAEQLQRPALQVDAAVFMGVDALESADRRAFDKALGVSRWVAERDANPRLLWRADTLAAGVAHLDGKIDEANILASRAEEIGHSINTPGWFAAKMFFIAQAAISSEDLTLMESLLLEESHVGMINPLALSGIAYCFACHGNRTTAISYARTALRHLDFEASPLLLLSRVAAVALRVGEADLRQEVAELLTPWADHVSIDANGWWCDGPIALWLALLHEALGDKRTAQTFLEVARPLVASLHDARSQRRLRDIDSRLTNGASPRLPHALSAREVQVLRLLSAGLTNAAIAMEMSFSVSTVRNDTTAIYRKLGVTGRAEAVTKAHELGLIGRVDQVPSF
jgi:DNA-binding CsgD family transcriptional regulator